MSDAAPHGPGGSPRRAITPARLKLIGVGAIALAAIVVVTGVIGRNHAVADSKTWTGAQAVTPVSVVYATPQTGGQTLVLPGALQAYYNAQIFSRVPGYVHAWYDDIGARVKQGQLMAVIDTPELDQQLIQARADLESTEANMALAKTTADRWASLLSQDAVSKQESDEKSGDFKVKTALVNAAKANVDRLMALKAFARIVAPFDGVVTARKTDIGALVNAGAGANPNAELFDVAMIDQLRLYVHVPQSYAALIHPGVTATLTVPEHPGQTFPATFTSTADAVSDSSGTLLVQMAVANPGDALKAGDYAQVTFALQNQAATATALRLPTSAVLFRKSGTEAAVVGADGRVQLKPVQVGRDLGASMEISGGLAPTEAVINNPPDSVASGQPVKVVAGLRLGG